MTTGQQLVLRSIDDYLGPCEQRFFSRGFQRAEYEVRDLAVAVDEQGAGEVGGAVDLRYPADWSKKKDGVDLRPHLSTIDALVLGVQLAELHATTAHQLDAAARRAARLRKITIKAGTAPQEELHGVPLAARLQRTKPDTEPGWVRSVYDCAVGALQVRCEIGHRSGPHRPGETGYGSLTDALGPGEQRYYGEAFKQRRHTIEDVTVDTGSWTAQAVARFRSGPGAQPAPEGVDGGTQPSVSLIDCFVVNLQLAQVLLYELDALRRENSNTLWMMQSVLSAAEVPQPLALPLAPAEPEPLPARTSIVGKRLLPLRGGTWRSVDLEGRLGGVELRCAFAHELPAGHQPATR
jgi:Pseudomonas avirulence D protein (AvrD)